MEKYSNLGGRSGVREYSIGHDYILVKFSDGSLYCILSSFNPIKKLQKSLFSAWDFPSIKRDFIV